jgi:hypothetical protein
MKKTIVALLLTLSGLTMAHEIEGTLVLKGTLRTKIVVNTVETTCRVKVAHVRNLLEEDSFGNPAYLLDLEIALGGHDSERRIRVKHDQKVQLTNLFRDGNSSIVRDHLYVSRTGDVRLEVKPDGRLDRIQFGFERRVVTCNF